MLFVYSDGINSIRWNSVFIDDCGGLINLLSLCIMYMYDEGNYVVFMIIIFICFFCIK